LDSVVSNRSNISYFYKQEIPTAEAEGNMLSVTLQGRVSALDHSGYRFPLSDTLEYSISSMLSFVDTMPRYVTRIIEKYAVVNDRNHLNFEVNRSDIIDTLAGNETQLARIESLMDEILNQTEFYVDSIILTASASPEGSVRKNDALARDRAHSLRERLVRKFPHSRIDTLISVRWIGEDWTELVRLLREDDGISMSDRARAGGEAGKGRGARPDGRVWPNGKAEAIGRMRNREAILDMIAEHGARGSADGRRDMDALEKEIRARFPEDYRYMLETLYPRLRAVSFKYDLRRVGMLKDTIHTTVPDTLYARGVKLLKGRKYNEALNILGGFYDRNAAVCMLSLGLDEQAYFTLKALPENSTHRYLLAIVCARLGRDDEALSHFDRAVELNPNLKYRGRLDPEISPLLDRMPPDAGREITG
jgi:hypothetical protein